MKRRELKKVINLIAADLFAECVFAQHYKSTDNPDDVDNVMRNILLMRDDMVSRISHVEPGCNAKIFFGKLKSDLNRTTDEIVEQIKGLV